MFTSSFPDYKTLYELSDPLATRPLRLSDEGFDKKLTREQVWQLARGEIKPNQPLKLGAYQGGQATDLLWTGFVHLICISERVAEIFTENKITGWSTFPVKIFDRKRIHLPGYYGFAITGPDCERDRNRSQIIEEPATPYRRAYSVYKGLYFDESQWDGSDIFRVQPFGGVVVTEAVYNLFKKAKISNVRFTALPEVEIDVLLNKYGK